MQKYLQGKEKHARGLEEGTFINAKKIRYADAARKIYYILRTSIKSKGQFLIKTCKTASFKLKIIGLYWLYI